MRNHQIFRPIAIFEFLAFWRGGVTAAELGSALGLTREAAQRSIVAQYKRDYPHTTLRRWRRTHIDGDANSLKTSPWRMLDAVNFTSAAQAFAEALGKESFLGVPVEDLANPLDIDNDVERFRELYAAIARRRAVYLDYAAKGGRLQLVFSPHAVVRTPARLHFRGHSSRFGKRGGRYIDIVPGRIISLSPVSKDDYVGAADDVEWYKKVSIVAELNPELPKTARQSVMLEHQCQDWLTIESVRHAVADYVVGWLVGRRLRNIPDPIWSKVQKVEEPTPSWI